MRALLATTAQAGMGEPVASVPTPCTHPRVAPLSAGAPGAPDPAAGCRMLDAFWPAGGSGSAAASHSCAQRWLCGTGLSSSGETPQSRGQCLQDSSRYSSNLPGIITELWATLLSLYYSSKVLFNTSAMYKLIRTE